MFTKPPLVVGDGIQNTSEDQKEDETIMMEKKVKGKYQRVPEPDHTKRIDDDDETVTDKLMKF
jgi:hypothetical protein